MLSCDPLQPRIGARLVFASHSKIRVLRRITTEIIHKPKNEAWAGKKQPLAESARAGPQAVARPSTGGLPLMTRRC